jgi:hypothetical protein
MELEGKKALSLGLILPAPIEFFEAEKCRARVNSRAAFNRDFMFAE